MLFIICMLVGVIILSFGMRLSVKAFKTATEENSNMPAHIIAIVAMLIGLWVWINSLEVYQYIVPHGLWNLFF